MKTPKLLRVILIVGIFLIVASAAFSRALRSNAARRYLIAHLEASFGRPVDVSWFDFSLLDGARIEAHFVSVSEDPRFGNEYFLRSDALAAGLRWSSLLAGRFEFGSVSLSRPSLNLVRGDDGQWNIERWLPPPPAPDPRPGFVGPVRTVAEVRAARPALIDVEEGRINFKRGENKISFALVGVSGRVEQNGAGRWQIDLEARPMRAGVELQDIGTLRLRGSIAGTTARLQPAELSLTWRAASVADTLRLIRGNDYGMRGELSVDLEARISPQQSAAISAANSVPNSAPNSGGARWSVSAVARLTGIHGWRLPERAGDPSANLSLEADWRLGQPRVDIRKLFVQMPSSQLEGIGDIDWAHGLRPELRVESASLALGDVLSWYRALRPDVAANLQAAGTVGLNLSVGGWPVQLQQGAISSAGGTLAAKSLPASLRIGAWKASVSRGEIELSPTEISFAPTTPQAPSDVALAAADPRNFFVVRGSLSSQVGGAFRWRPDWNFSIEGATPRVQDWLALSNALAQPLNSGWTAAGGLAVKLRAEHRADSAVPPWTGGMDFVALTLTPSYVNQPVVLGKAHVEFTPVQRAITLSAAQAFGTAWHGSLARKYSEKQWTFDLTADSLDAVQLDRWLGPRARPGFLARMIGSEKDSGAASPPSDAPVTRLAARGRLRAGIVGVPPLRIEKFDGQAEIAGRSIRILSAQGDFFGGNLSGTLDAQLLRNPSYEFQGRFDRVDLAQLARAVASLNGRIGGTASAAMTLSAHGIGRQDLIDSITGQGTVNGRSVWLRGIDLSSATSAGGSDDTPDLIASLQGAYRIQNKSVDLANFVLESSRGRLDADGRVDFSHALDIRIRPSMFQAASAPVSASSQTLLLGGTIEAPNLVLASAAPKQARPR